MNFDHKIKKCELSKIPKIPDFQQSLIQMICDDSSTSEQYEIANYAVITCTQRAVANYSKPEANVCTESRYQALVHWYQQKPRSYEEFAY